MINNHFFFSLFFVALLYACGGSKTTTNGATEDAPSVKCTTTAHVKDMRGLDGCQFLLELDNGEKLLPTAFENLDFKLQHNQIVKFGYKEVPDAVSVCMAESRSVIVTCIEEVGLTGGVKPVKPQKVACEKLDAPFDRNWMKDLTIKHQPTRIDRYDYLDGWAYHLYNADREYVYDCQGNLLCEGKPNNPDCGKVLSRMSNLFTIWVVNH